MARGMPSVHFLEVYLDLEVDVAWLLRVVLVPKAAELLRFPLVGG